MFISGLMDFLKLYPYYGYYSALERMKLYYSIDEPVVVSERSQAQKITYSVCEIYRIGKSIEIRADCWLSQAGDRGE